MSRNGKIHTKKRQFRQMPVLAFLNQRLFLQPLLIYVFWGCTNVANIMSIKIPYCPIKYN